MRIPEKYHLNRLTACGGPGVALWIPVVTLETHILATHQTIAKSKHLFPCGFPVDAQWLPW